MWILGLVCLIGWLLSMFGLSRLNMGNSEATAGIGCMIMIFYGVFITVLWLLAFFGIGFFIYFSLSH